MFYNIFIKLQFIQTQHNYTHDNLIKFKNIFIKKLSEQQSTIFDSTYMTESNGCITLEITIKNKELSKKSIIQSLRSLLSDNINGFYINADSQYTTFLINENNLLNFNSEKHQALIDIETIPHNINIIMVNSKMALSRDDTPEFFFSFLDIENNKIDYKPEWISIVNNIYSKYFETDQAMDIKLGTVKKMLLGDNYQALLKNAHFKIITQFMDNFDLFEKNKIEDNVILTNDFI